MFNNLTQIMWYFIFMAQISVSLSSIGFTTIAVFSVH